MKTSISDMMWHCLVAGAAAMVLGGCALTADSSSVERALVQQAAAWNGGDLDSFLDYYEKSADLTFSSGGETRKGWTEVSERYRKRYPDRATMGSLQFSNLHITPLSNDAAMVLGDWRVTRETDSLGGNFTLVMRRIGGRWLIVHDHTSVRPAN